MMKKLIGFILLGSLLISNNASAFGITGSDQYAIQEAHSGFGTAIDNSQGTWTRIYTLQKVNDDYWVNLPASGLANVTVMSLKLNKNIPANSLVSLSVTWTTESVGSTGFIYHSLQFEHNRSLLWDSCINFAGQPIYSSDKFMTLTCNYVFYNASDTNIIDSIYGSHIWEVIHQADVDDHVNVVIRQPTSIQLSNNGLTYSDRLWLQQNMPGASEAQVQDAVENAERSHDEEQQEKYEDQQEDVDGGASDAGDEAEEATSSLIDTGKSIIETIRDTPATNCVIRIKSGGFDTGNLNLCNVPQTIRTVISTIITIPVTLAALHIAYSVIMLYLNTVRKEQE